MRDTIRLITMDPTARQEFHVAYCHEIVGFRNEQTYSARLQGVHALARSSCRAMSACGLHTEPAGALIGLQAMAHDKYTPMWAGRLRR